MAAALTTTLALCALLAGASARGRNEDEHCTTATKGETSGYPVPLPPVPLPAHIKNWQVDIPSDTVCAPGKAVGYTIKACDPEAPPKPTIATLSLKQAIVTRETHATTEGTIDVTVYCQPGGVLHDSRKVKVVSAVPYV